MTRESDTPTDPHADDFCVVCGRGATVTGPSMYPVSDIKDGCICDGCIEDDRVPDTRQHDTIEITAQRWAWNTTLTALEVLVEDGDAAQTLKADAKPVVRTLEIALGISDEERTSEVLDGERVRG